MQFRPSADIPGSWLCIHPLKGTPAELESGKPPRRVPAVTGACLMVSRQLYDELGGLAEDYIINDFEDADFCHQVAEAGGAIWYEPRVQLYHIERQSISRSGDAAARHLVTLVNMWKHGQRWKHRLSQLPLFDDGSIDSICEETNADSYR